MFQKILVPLDGSEVSDSILSYVSFTAKRLDIPVLLLSVVDPDSLDLPQHAEELIGPWERALSGHLSDMVSRLESEGVTTDSLIEYGRASEGILRVSQQEGCDLIAMSTKGRGLMGWGMLGSVTYHVVHSATVPTLTIAPEKTQNLSGQGTNISRILVPLDGSAIAEEALPYVEYLAERISAEVVLIRVVPTSRVYPALLARLFSPEIQEQTEAEATEYLQGVANRLNAIGLAVNWRVLRGVPGPSIVEVAQESFDDLIVMTAHGKSGLLPRVMGSVSISVLRNSGDPVLIIPPSDAKKS